MNTVFEKSSVQNSMYGLSQDEQFVEGSFYDDKHLLEELEPYEFALLSETANGDLWDLLEINESEWDAANQGGFLIP